MNLRDSILPPYLSLPGIEIFKEPSAAKRLTCKVIFSSFNQFDKGSVKVQLGFVISFKNLNGS